LLAEEIGCFLSHRAVWEAVARGDDDWVFVAEDDLHFCAAAGAFFSNDDWRPGDADIVKAETFGDRTEIAARASSRPFGHNLRRLLSYHGGSAGYFLGRAAASRLVGLTERACGLADYILFDPVLGVADSFRRYQLDPAICVQDGRLADESKRKSFESTLELARAAVKNREPTPTEPTRLAKLRRESKRLLTYSTLFVNGARLRRIPFADDWRNRDSRTFGHADDG
jgi:glycosyl transferase family 25